MQLSTQYCAALAVSLPAFSFLGDVSDARVRVLCFLKGYLFTKKIGPRGQLFSLRALQGRVFLGAVSARCRAQAGAVCVQKFLSCQLALRVMTDNAGVVPRCARIVLLEGSRPISAGETRYSHLVQ